MRSRRRDTQERIFDWIPLTLAIAGLALNLLLLSRHFPGSAAGIAGCGGGDCEEVLASRWAYAFHIPVTVFGAATHIILIVSFRRRFESWHAPALGLIAGAAVWFLFVQAAILDRYCPWCMAAHSLALSLFAFCLIRMIRRRDPSSWFLQTGGWMAAGILAIGLAQVYGPEPSTHRIDDVGQKAADGGGPEDGTTQAQPVRDLTSLPLLGSTAARHVMVEYFDYQCAACRTMAGHLAALIARHPDALAVRLAPVPMDRLCNSLVPAGSQRSGSCEIAKTALAVWIHAPEQFPDFHRKLLDDPTPETARGIALSLMETDLLADLMAGSQVMDLIRGNVADWRSFSRHNPKLPKLWIRPGRMLHGLPSSEESFIDVMERELGL